LVHGVFNQRTFLLRRKGIHRKKQGGRTQNDFRLAWLEAEGNLSEGGELANLIGIGFKKSYVLLYYYSIEFESTLTVHCTDPFFWEFPFFRRYCLRGRGKVYV
jgi:hypothetical protein